MMTQGACAERLRALIKEDSFVVEAFLMDAQGALVCASRETSDYWQWAMKPSGRRRTARASISSSTSPRRTRQRPAPARDPDERPGLEPRAEGGSAHLDREDPGFPPRTDPGTRLSLSASCLGQGPCYPRTAGEVEECPTWDAV